MSPVLWTRKSTFAGIFQGFIPGVCIPGLQEKKKFRGPRVEGDINDQGPRAEKKKYLNFEQSLAEG